MTSTLSCRMDGPATRRQRAYTPRTIAAKPKRSRSCARSANLTQSRQISTSSRNRPATGLQLPSDCAFDGSLQVRASAIVLQRGNCKIHPHSAEKFANAEDAFAALDDDGGGELSRVELARGLRAVRRWVGFVECGGIRFVCTAPVDLYVRVCAQVGIWMTPNELGAFVEALDQVCGGDYANIGCGGPV